TQSTMQGPVESFLVRGVGRGRLLWSTGPHVLRLGADLGGKVYFERAATPQDVVVARLGLDERSRIGSRLRLGGAGGYHGQYRGYHGRALRLPGDDAKNLPGGAHALPRRDDLVGSFSLSLSYTGPVLASASWLVEKDRSASAEGGYLYQAVALSLTMPLPAKL